MNKYTLILQNHTANSLFDFDYLIDREGVLDIYLCHKDGLRRKISFDSYLVYKKADEGDALVTINELSQQRLLNNSFFRVDDSEFIRWFISQGYGKYQSTTMSHYLVITINDVIDVISLDPPLVTDE